MLVDKFDKNIFAELTVLKFYIFLIFANLFFHARFKAEKQS